MKQKLTITTIWKSWFLLISKYIHIYIYISLSLSMVATDTEYDYFWNDNSWSTLLQMVVRNCRLVVFRFLSDRQFLNHKTILHVRWRRQILGFFQVITITTFSCNTTEPGRGTRNFGQLLSTPKLHGARQHLVEFAGALRVPAIFPLQTKKPLRKRFQAPVNDSQNNAIIY